MLGIVLGAEDAVAMMHTYLKETEVVMSMPKEMKGDAAE